MDLVVELRFGSHLYGTDTPQSDTDIKGVYLPRARDILLQRVRATVAADRVKTAGQRNTAGDVDREVYSLDRYLHLLAEAQNVALEMLFAPDSAMTKPPAPLWRELQANADRLISRRASIFVRYCRQQASRYGLKGARLAAARQALHVLQTAEARLGTTGKLAALAEPLAELARQADYVSLVDMPLPGGRLVRHLDVCGRRVPFTATIKLAREIVERLVGEYGARAQQAEDSAGVDWKALSHAVRVGREAIELLQTGRIVFPLSCAPHLRRIRGGEIAEDAVSAEIERLVEEVEAAAATSGLPDAPDQVFIDDLIVRAYGDRIREGD